MKYNYNEIKREISGFGGEYEMACRDMVLAGLQWIENNPNCELSYKTYKNIYGLTTGESKDMELCQEAMIEAVEDCSGAMLQAAMGHLMFIKVNGWDEYKHEMNKAERNQDK